MRSVFALFSAPVLVCAIACLSHTVLATEMIVVGQSVPLSGANASFGRDVRIGALAHFGTANALGGINGRLIELRSLDDANDANRSGENTRLLLNDPRVVALFGYGSATLSAPAVPQAQAAGVAFVAPFTGAERMRQSSDVVFNIRASYTDEIAEFMRVMGSYQKRVAVVHYDDAVGKENLATAQKTLTAKSDVEIVSIALTRNRENVAAAAEQISNSELGVVLLTILSSPGAELVKAVRIANKNMPMFGAISFTSSSHLSRALAATRSDTGRYGVAVSSVVPNPRSSVMPAALEYQAAMRRFYPGELLSLTGFESFLAAKMLTSGFRKTSVINRRTVLDALGSITELDLGGYVVKWPQSNRYGSRYVELFLIRGPDTFSQL
jgi:branched-chain amino acid transport system substrate-binding protein